MKWISVKEKLPQDKMPVFVAYKKTFPNSCKGGLYWATCTRIKYEWTTFTHVHIKTPDYWEPIAPLPKDGE